MRAGESYVTTRPSVHDGTTADASAENRHGSYLWKTVQHPDIRI